ncbi:hypothetical protein [Allosphingosinicella indica]|uniref:DUF2268 domain-containing protein n=1 Tax=Allosphingosinicella indica TaxID=941907 RepID=A0A1X7G1G3_9SPHN|nr:hypothetical protein [Allosphingosinicella indica]SMF61837.1 hypothetical protein SAMN06295910_0837 [Allosphingosinicella indica]
MIRRTLLALGLSLTLSAAAPVASDLAFVDLTDDFAKTWDATQALDDAARVTAFKQAFAAKLPGFYDHRRIKVDEALYDKHLLKALKAYPENRDAIAKVSAQFASSIAPALASFEAEFGPMRGYPPVYLVNSLGEFDGGTRNLPEGVRLLFGADMLAKLHGDDSIQPFFHHELFHLLHTRTFPECDQMWCALWAEGLAVHVAKTLNPGADDAALLLTQPEPIRAAVDANRTHAVCAVLTRLDSTDPKDYRALFSSGRLDDRLPPRFGYYVGLLVAQDLGRTRDLKQLAVMDAATVRPLLERSLKAMGDC